MEFNSLDAQREACEAYVASQRAEGWVLVPDRYDDGGISGATLERPALKRLLSDVEAGLVDVVVVYKIDRLSRSLTDFSKLVEVFEANERHLRLGHAELQHDDLDGQADAQHPALLRAVRARGDRRAHPGQVRGLAAQGHVDGRQRPARLSRREPQAAHPRGGGRNRPHDLRAVPVDRLGNHSGAHAQCRGRHQPRRQADRQGLSLQAAQQPGLHRRGRAQGHQLSRRAPGDHHRETSGTRCARSLPRARASGQGTAAGRHRHCCRA